MEFDDKCAETSKTKFFGYGMGWEHTRFKTDELCNNMFKDCESMEWTIDIETIDVTPRDEETVDAADENEWHRFG